MDIRNIAIIAHVDHGKTTLVDSLFRQSGTFRSNENIEERAMDNQDLERERGITILAKPTSIVWNNTRINIIDTPGHADFGGEVERILSMIDGVILLVDAAEGPLPQTKFVLSKALAMKLRPIVVINKIDRSDERADEVLDEIFDLFVGLDADEQQLDFPVLYASGRQGWAVTDPKDKPEDGNLEPLFQLILNHVPAPQCEKNAPFSMLTSILSSDPYLGRILIGRIASGQAQVNMPVHVLRDNEKIETGRLSKLFGFHGLERQARETIEAGDIIAIAGLSQATVADTICAPECLKSLPCSPIDPPTLAMTFSVNDSPLAGQEGSKVTSRMIKDRLEQEAEINIAIHIKETQAKDAFEVCGRGELQLGVLIETMRREGFELSISRPHVLMKEEKGQKYEPFEEVVIDVDEEHSGIVVEKMTQRKGKMLEMRPSGSGKTRLVFHAPSRGLIGYFSEFLTDTRGTGIMNRLFHEYGPDQGFIQGRLRGVLISNATGPSVGYALFNLEDRGHLFIEAGKKVYTGMIIGEHSRENDLDVNPLKSKKLSNVRASGKDEAIVLTPPRKMTLESAMSYIQADELIEVTPENIRLRKKYLDANDRKKHQKKNA